MKTLLVATAVLFALVGASWLLAILPHAAWSTPATLGISGTKALIVAWYFMELREARTSIRAAILVAVLLFVLLLTLTVVDVATREAPPLIPPGW